MDTGEITKLSQVDLKNFDGGLPKFKADFLEFSFESIQQQLPGEQTAAAFAVFLYFIPLVSRGWRSGFRLQSKGLAFDRGVSFFG